jgi:hypothetical protein
MNMHIWLRNGFPVFLIFGLWIKPPCRLSIAVLNELSFAAAYMAVGIALLKVCAHVRRRYDHRTPALEDRSRSALAAAVVEASGAR